MANIKLLIVLVLLLLGFQESYGQTYNFTTSGFSVLEKNQKGKWGNWTDLELVNIVVKLDTNKNRVIIYSEAIQVYEIIEYLPFEEGETDDKHTFICINNLGEQCTLSILIRKKQDNRKQLYINYDDRIIVYNISNFNS
jgi:hypothetical protein